MTATIRDAEAGAAFVGEIDRLPLPVKSAPGFLVNRALTPYMLEAMVMLDEKVQKETIDEAAEKFGMPMGPIELADQVGLDICLAVGDLLRAKLGDRAAAGAGTGCGRRWRRANSAARPARASTSGRTARRKSVAVAARSPQPREMIDRLILPMLNVCVACLREGIVEDADVVDGAMIFGTGFAPFRGGPLHYARSRGTENRGVELRTLAAQYGDRFEPDAGWESFK